MKKYYSGIAMIEVLISMGLISLVLLSLLSYQINAFKNSQVTNFKNIASAQLINFSEMLLMNKTTGARDKAFLAWNKENRNLLPQGEGEYDQLDDHICDIAVNWFFKKNETISIQVFC